MTKGKTKFITPAQYAEYYGCSLQNIGKHIRNETLLEMPNIISLQNAGRFYLIEVPEKLSSSKFKSTLIKYRNSKLKH